MDLNVVVAASRQDLRGLGLEVDEGSLDCGPHPFEPSVRSWGTVGAVANGSVLLITASATRGRALAVLIVVIALSTLTVSNPGCRSRDVPGWLSRRT